MVYRLLLPPLLILSHLPECQHHRHAQRGHGHALPDRAAPSTDHDQGHGRHAEPSTGDQERHLADTQR